MKVCFKFPFLLASLANGAFVKPQRASKNSKLQPAKIPRGGGSSLPEVLKPDQVIKVFTAFYALNGALSMPAPESAKDFALKEGTSDYVVFENLGAISLAYAGFVHMLHNGRTSVPRAAALSMLPYAYVTYKNALKGVTGRLSSVKHHGPISAALMIGAIYAILKGKGDASLISQLMAVPALAIGITAQFDQSVARKIAGFSTDLSSKTGQAIFFWYAALCAGWGALVLMAPKLSAMQAIGRAAILEALFMVDCIWIRKWNIGVAPDISNYVFLAVPVLMALSVFL